MSEETFTTSDGREIKRPRKKQAKVPLRYQQLIDGVINIEDLDEEELFRGQLRDSRGVIRGAPPKAIPWAMHKAYVDHVGQRLERTIIGSMEEIVEGLISIATGGRRTGDYGDTGIAMDVRAKAQMYLLDRILGKPTERQQVDVQLHAKWEQAFEGGSLVVDVPESDIIDVEPVEETDHPSRPALSGSGALVERPADTRDREDEAETAPQASQPRPRPKTGVKLK